MSDAEKLEALAAAYAKLCSEVCKDPMKNEAYREAVK